MEKRYMMMSLADILETEDIKQQLIDGINDVVKKHDKFEHTYECIRNHVLTQIIACLYHPKDANKRKQNRKRYVLDSMIRTLNRRFNTTFVEKELDECGVKEVVDTFMDKFNNNFERLPEDLSTPMEYYIDRGSQDWAAYNEKSWLDFQGSDVLAKLKMTISDGGPDDGFTDHLFQIFEKDDQQVKEMWSGITVIPRNTDTKSFRITYSNDFFKASWCYGKYSRVYRSLPMKTDEIEVVIRSHGNCRYSVSMRLNDTQIM